MNRNSIRWKLSVYMLVGTGLLLLIAGISLDFMVRSWLARQFDETLLAKTRAFVALTEQEEDHLEFDLADAMMPEFDDEDEPEYYQVWSGDEVFERSEMLGEKDLQRDGERSLEPRILDVVLPDGRSGRQIQVDFVPLLTIRLDGQDSDAGIDSTASGEIEDDGAGEDDENELEELAIDPSELVPGSGRLVASVVIAKSREPVDEAIGLFRIALGGVAIVLILAIGLLIHVIVPRGLEPLNEMGRQVATLDENSLDNRIDVRSDAEEIAPLVSTLNNLLRRLEKAFERERHFSSDVAHELRTPVAELKSLSEVGARWPEDVESVRRFFRDVQDVAGSMEHTINNLLHLARCDAGIEEISDDEVHLRETIDRLWRHFAPSAERRGVRFEQEIPPDLVIRTDSAKFELIMSNLLSNAVAYSRSGGTVSCMVRNGSNKVSLDVSNPVSELTEDDLSAMFERFWRKDDARTAGEHSGLGLALVRSLSDLLSFDLETSLSDDGGERVFRISLTRPLQTAI